MQLGIDCDCYMRWKMTAKIVIEAERIVLSCWCKRFMPRINSTPLHQFLLEIATAHFLSLEEMYCINLRIDHYTNKSFSGEKYKRKFWGWIFQTKSNLVIQFYHECCNKWGKKKLEISEKLFITPQSQPNKYKWFNDWISRSYCKYMPTTISFSFWFKMNCKKFAYATHCIRLKEKNTELYVLIFFFSFVFFEHIHTTQKLPQSKVY